MSTTRWCCDPIFRPSPGQEDKVLHSNTADRWFYVVGKGFTNGIYTDPEVARHQVHRFSGAAWKKAATWKEARVVWATFSLAHTLAAGNSSSIIAPVASFVAFAFAIAPTIRGGHAARIQFTRTFEQHVTAGIAPMRAAAAPSHASSSSAATTTVTQVRSPTANWQRGDRLYAIEGVPCLFETRYDAVDYVFENSMDEVRFLGSRNRRKLEAFVSRQSYVRRAGDPEDTD
ncbi:hypothetical protein B0H11DRAFT_2249234 [Mycena galericulata]|nr:hypothetical protein B0H11DRAFT_2249234 [Mycena galericulata]